MKKLSLALVIGFCLILIAGGAFAATDTETLTISAQVQDSATLTLSQPNITFPNANPDDYPVIDIGPYNVSARVRVASGAVSTLTHVAASDLVSGSDSIGINQVSWTATGTGYLNGTMNNSTPQSVGSFSGPGAHNGTFSYRLVNSWTYPVGTYTASSTYTLATP
jgi:hypothetical protein